MARFFSRFGTVEDAYVIMDRENPERSKGFGFVTIAGAATEDVISKSNGEELMVRIAYFSY